MRELRQPTPLISIIVPIYNVEEYLTQCLESISRQSYSNIEIIAINDGSPDGSANIADEFSRKEPRLRVIHTENRGVSAARNLGIEESTGEFIVFVDSDDWLAADFVDYMLRIIRETGSDFAMSRNCFKAANESQVESDQIEKYSPGNAAAALLYPQIEIGCWNKIFSTDFLKRSNIKFPVTFFMGEGLNFIVQAAQLSNCVGVGSRKVYFYRKDNINSATTKVSIKKFINALAAIDNIRRNATLETSEFKMALNFHQYMTTFYALRAVIMTDGEKTHPIEFKKWSSAIKSQALSMMKAQVSKPIKAKILLYGISPIYAFKSWNFLRKMKRKFLSQAT